MRARDWTESQFAVLHANPGVSAADLARLIGRRIGAVEVIRWGAHSWHVGGDVSALSKMMLAFLERHRGLTVSAKCSETL